MAMYTARSGKYIIGDLAVVAPKQCPGQKCMCDWPISMPAMQVSLLLGCQNRCQEQLLSPSAIVTRLHITSYFPQEHKHMVADAMEMIEYKAGEMVFKQGEIGDKFYIVKEGSSMCLLQSEIVVVFLAAMESSYSWGDICHNEGLTSTACILFTNVGFQKSSSYPLEQLPACRGSGY